MHTTEERVLSVLDRRTALKYSNRQRWVGGALAALCLLLAVGCALAVSQLSLQGIGTGAQSTASLFAKSGMLGYAVVAILAFLLGVTATLFCFLLGKERRRHDP